MISPPRCKALLLDMNSTFMFGEDRFGPDEDFFATYRAFGEGSLTAAEVERAIRSAHAGLSADYVDPARFDDYPSLDEAIRRHADVPDAEVAAVERVFAAHEMGQVPAAFAACLRRLGAHYELGIVSNIWGRSDPWLAHFEEVGIAGLWRTTVFSSDTRSIKPSPALFRRAIGALGVEPSDILFIGDSLRADIEPAKALGMATAWVGASAGPHRCADWTGPSLLELEQVLAPAPVR